MTFLYVNNYLYIKVEATLWQKITEKTSYDDLTFNDLYNVWNVAVLYPYVYNLLNVLHFGDIIFTIEWLLTSILTILSIVFGVTDYGIWYTLQRRKPYKKYWYHNFALRSSWRPTLVNFIAQQIILKCIQNDNKISANMAVVQYVTFIDIHDLKCCKKSVVMFFT